MGVYIAREYYCGYSEGLLYLGRNETNSEFLYLVLESEADEYEDGNNNYKGCVVTSSCEYEAKFNYKSIVVKFKEYLTKIYLGEDRSGKYLAIHCLQKNSLVIFKYFKNEHSTFFESIINENLYVDFFDVKNYSSSNSYRNYVLDSSIFKKVDNLILINE